MPATATDQLSTVFSALADPTRRAILGELAEGKATVSELTASFPISMPAVSRHLKVLEHASLISRSRSGKWRTSQLDAAPLRDAAKWIERYRRFWDSSLDRLDAHLAAVQAAGHTEDGATDNDPTSPRRRRGP
ncbi:MAG: metalloregulator ArsR/SmtB family transcription factor [Solirubrobacteraceae bacterium]